jgi:hypothetical protein
MKMLFKPALCTLCFAVLASVPSLSAQTDILIGVWRVTESRLTSLSNPHKNPVIIKDPWPGAMIFTKRHFSWVDAHDNPNADLPKDPALADYAADFEQLTAFSGTYAVKGSTITVDIFVSKDPADIREDSYLHFDYKFDGDWLVLTLKDWKKHNMELKLRRLE